MSVQIMTFREALFLPTTIKRSVKVALLVGTLLIFINHANTILSGHWPEPWEVLLTYLVPYLVSSHATAANKSETPKHQDL
jgi:hypothetical protein